MKNECLNQDSNLMQLLTFWGPQAYVDIVKRSNIEHDSMIEFDCSAMVAGSPLDWGRKNVALNGQQFA